jgi:hypothetical protein
MSKAPVRPAEGAGTTATVHVQQDLATRTLQKLHDACNFQEYDDPEALDIMQKALVEAHCDVTLWNVHWWDLAGNSRIVADGDIMIPYPSLPDVGTVIQWQGRSYYVASHRPSA